MADPLGRSAPAWRPFRPVSGPVGRGASAAVVEASRVLWCPVPGLAVAVEPPRTVHAGPDGLLHRVDGPSVEWRDGSTEHHVLGVAVPEPGPDGWTAGDIRRVTTSEARRIMIETVGWDAYLDQADLRLVGEAADPGNAPHRPRIHELPDDVHGPLRLLVMTNGSPDRAGRLRRHAEFVPGHLADPVESAAWQYGVEVELYRALRRRT